MALPLAAGSTALRFLRTLYKAKKKVGKGASMAASYAGKKGFPKTSPVSYTHLRAHET